MSDIDRIKQKLAKLLKLGECSAATDGEITNALEIATTLMAKHQLTREDIDMDAVDPVSRVALGRHFAFCKGSNISIWENQVRHFVMRFFGTVESYKVGKQPIRRNGIAGFYDLESKGTVRSAMCLAFYGADEDARCAAELFEELRDTIATMAIVRWGGWARGDGVAYALGFANSLLDAQQSSTAKLANTDATTTSLILKSEANNQLIISKGKDWLKESHGVNLKGGGKKGRGLRMNEKSVTAYNEGKRDGSNYQVGAPQHHQRLA